MIIHTIEQASKAALVDRVIVATDDERILQEVTSAGFEAVMTSPAHLSGSDRIAEVAASLPAGSIVVNVQGDEPTISPDTINAAVSVLLGDNDCNMATTCERIDDPQDVLSPNVVKVVTDANGNALYFSRSPIPFPRNAVNRHGSLLNLHLRPNRRLLGDFRKHTGLYVYRREYLLEFCQMQQTPLETAEMLEQLRAIENGARIKVVEVSDSSIGVDTAADLERVRLIIEQNG